MGAAYSAQTARNANIYSLTHNAAVRTAYGGWNVTDSVLTDAFIPDLPPAPAQTETASHRDLEPMPNTSCALSE